MDVRSLYQSIPRQDGITAVEKALNLRSNKSLPTEEVLPMVNIVLDNNNFRLNGNDYLQIDGTAIGSRLGMNYASTCMGEWERVG